MKVGIAVLSCVPAALPYAGAARDLLRLMDGSGVPVPLREKGFEVETIC